jgi:choice-of-anchor B domain-containing protein
MKIRNLIAFITLLFLTKSTAQLSPTVNLTFRSKLGFGVDCANICGYAAGGKEYALVGNMLGTAIVDVTDPNNPILSQYVTGITSRWREIKVYKDYAYITSEANNSALQIVDLSALPSTVPVKVYAGGDSILTTIQRVHALHIDEAKGFVYLFGANSVITPLGGVATNTNGKAVVLDIKTDPWNPKFVGQSIWTYIHDGYVRGDTLYSGNIYEGFFSIIDFRDKKNPIRLGTQRTPTAFNHNSWLSDDSKTLFTTDENTGSYIGAYDVSDPLNIRFLDKIRSVSENNAVVHNVHVHNDYLVTSWYTEGVTITDAHRPQNLVQVGQYDTYEPPFTTANPYRGCWGVYPYLPSGNLIVSNLTDSLFVLTPNYVRACYLEGVATDAVSGSILGGVLVKINSTDMDKKAQSDIQGIYRTGQVTAGTVSVTYSKAGYFPKTITGVVLANGVVTLQNVALQPVPAPVELIDFQGITDKNKIKLLWRTATEINVKAFEIEKLMPKNGLDNWERIGTTKANNAPSEYVSFDINPTMGTNYYRLKTVDDDGSFAYSKVISVAFLNTKSSVFLYPNPSKNRLFLSNNSFTDNQTVLIMDIVGKVVVRSTIGQGRTGFDIGNLSNGEYFLMVDGDAPMKFTKVF